MRKNLLINPFFKVNQRGNITYTSNGYCVDNWEITYKDTEITALLYMTITLCFLLDRNVKHEVDQFIEDADAVFGKTVTGSALLEDGTLRTGSAVFQKSSGDIRQKQYTPIRPSVFFAVWPIDERVS